MHYGAVFRASVDRADWGPEPPKSDAWCVGTAWFGFSCTDSSRPDLDRFRDLTVMQGQLTLAIHRALEDRLDKESRAAAAAAAAGDAGATRGAGVDAEGLERAKRIKRHSDVRLLDAGRALAGLLVSVRRGSGDGASSLIEPHVCRLAEKLRQRNCHSCHARSGIYRAAYAGELQRIIHSIDSS